MAGLCSFGSQVRMKGGSLGPASASWKLFLFPLWPLQKSRFHVLFFFIYIACIRLNPHQFRHKTNNWSRPKSLQNELVNTLSILMQGSIHKKPVRSLRARKLTKPKGEEHIKKLKSVCSENRNPGASPESTAETQHGDRRLITEISRKRKS